MVLVAKTFEGYEPTEGSTPAFSCVCDSAGRACIKTESCSNGCRNGQCLPEPAVKALPKESVPTPPPFPATECEADKVTETDTPAGKSRTKIIGIEKIMVFGRACSTCHQKFEYIGSGRYVKRWSSRNFDAGEPGACQKMTLTVANPENPAELKIDVSEMWINGLRQTCVKENGAMKSGPDVKCD